MTLPVASVALSQRYFEMLLCLEERGYISQSRDGERYRGYEERASYEVDGVINIPVPVLDDRGRAIAALTVPFLQKNWRSDHSRNCARSLTEGKCVAFGVDHR